MINPDFLFAAFAVLTAVSVADGAWRLWRQKPSKYASVLGESIVGVALLFVIVVTPTSDDRLHVGVKAVVVAGVIVATILRLVARKRFAVES